MTAKEVIAEMQAYQCPRHERFEIERDIAQWAAALESSLPAEDGAGEAKAWPDESGVWERDGELFIASRDFCGSLIVSNRSCSQMQRQQSFEGHWRRCDYTVAPSSAAPAEPEHDYRELLAELRKRVVRRMSMHSHTTYYYMACKDFLAMMDSLIPPASPPAEPEKPSTAALVQALKEGTAAAHATAAALQRALEKRDADLSPNK